MRDQVGVFPEEAAATAAFATAKMMPSIVIRTLWAIPATSVFGRDCVRGSIEVDRGTTNKWSG